MEDHPRYRKWLGSPPFVSYLGQLDWEEPYLGNLLTVAIKNLLTGMILQVSSTKTNQAVGGLPLFLATTLSFEKGSFQNSHQKALVDSPFLPLPNCLPILKLTAKAPETHCLEDEICLWGTLFSEAMSVPPKKLLSEESLDPSMEESEPVYQGSVATFEGSGFLGLVDSRSLHSRAGVNGWYMNWNSTLQSIAWETN